MKRCEATGGRYYVWPICFDAKQLDEAVPTAGAGLQGTVPMWNWIGEDATTTFSTDPRFAHARRTTVATDRGGRHLVHSDHRVQDHPHRRAQRGARRLAREDSGQASRHPRRPNPGPRRSRYLRADRRVPLLRRRDGQFGPSRDQRVRRAARGTLRRPTHLPQPRRVARGADVALERREVTDRTRRPPLACTARSFAPRDRYSAHSGVNHVAKGPAASDQLA
jgi:hypothetical protein